MSYTNPISKEAPRLDVGLDMVLNHLVDEFKTKIPWLENRVFHRAYEFRVEDGGRIFTEPRVYFGKKEYYPVLYNDNLPCSVFFRIDGDEQIDYSGYNKRHIDYTRPLSLIFWGQLNRIQHPEAADYIYTELIKRDFMAVLGRNSYVREIVRFIDEPIEKVFDGYTLTDSQRLLSMYPYACMKIDFTTTYATPVVPC